MNFLVLELDGLRSFFIKILMKSRIARSLFVDRAIRLSFSAFLSFSISLVLVSAFPVWVLILGPIVFGIPHLFAGGRYLPTLLSQPSRLLRIAGIMLLSLVAAVRVFGNRGDSLGWDILIGLTFTVILAALRKSRTFSRFSALQSALYLGILALLFWRWPLFTLASLAFGHNLVAYFYWWAAAKNPTDRRAVAFALSLFALGSVICLTPLLDPLVYWGGEIITDPKSPWLNPLILAQQIIPEFHDNEWLLPVLRTFAFGQSLHYFVWLKAIPEQTLAYGTPMSFRQSWYALNEDLGKPLAWLALLTSVGFVASLFWIPLTTVRTVYLTIAASHGFLELAGLPFLRKIR